MWRTHHIWLLLVKSYFINTSLVLSKIAISIEMMMSIPYSKFLKMICHPTLSFYDYKLKQEYFIFGTHYTIFILYVRMLKLDFCAY